MTAPLAVYRHFGASSGTERLVLMQHGSYLIADMKSQPYIDRGEAVLYRGVQNAELLLFRRLTTADIRLRFISVHARSLADSVTSFNAVHCNVSRTETGWFNDRSFMLSDLCLQAGLAFPVIVDPNNLPRTAPTDYDRHRKSEDFQEWGLQVQQILPAGFTGQIGYQGIQANHLSSKSYINLIDPVTVTRPLASLGFPNQLGSVGSWSNSSYNGLLMSIQRTTRSGFFINFNYSWAHALNEGSQGGGGPNPTEIVSCVRCDWANSPSDQRQSLHGRLSYLLPFGKSKLWRGWSISAVGSFRTGLPLTVSTSRKATDTPDGNTAQQRPDVVTGVSLIPPGGQGINNWTNIAAFSAPAHGTWGMLERTS